jgi:hypothetical protein
MAGVLIGLPRIAAVVAFSKIDRAELAPRRWLP